MSTPRALPPVNSPSPNSRRSRWPLLAAGFLTAFGAHAIAANLGHYATDRHASLIELGVLLALYDGAEVVFKPVFGSLADRVGPRPVLLGGLLGFAVASAAFVVVGEPDALAVVRLAQGLAAAAFSPAAGALVAQLSEPGQRGRAFGSYGAWKGLGYALGPLLGSALVWLGGFRLLFGSLAAVGLGTAVWVALAVPPAPPLPKTRETVVGLVRRLSQPNFTRPVIALAAATAAQSAGVGFLPLLGAEAGLGWLATGAVVSLLAAASALVQPLAGRARDEGRLGQRAGMTIGLVVAASGCTAAVFLPHLVGLPLGGVAIGVGVGLVTPLGFAAVAEAAPPGRLGQTIGAAEVGRELGDAGGPLLVGALAAVASLGGGLLGLAGVLTAAAFWCARQGARRFTP